VAKTPPSAARAVAGAVRDTTTAPRPRDNGGDVVKAYTPPLEVVKAAEEPVREEAASVCSNDEYALLCREGFAREDVAAVTIQAYFRAHLVRELEHETDRCLLLLVDRNNTKYILLRVQARRAFKALKSLVRLQAVARGAYVRRQAEVAVHCMQAMARLQARVRARQTTLARPKPKDNDGEKLLLQS
jgi:hypothetical protein